MPSTTSDRKVQSRIKATNVARAVRAGSESSDTSPERGREIEDTGSGPEDLDQPWPYEFKVAVKGYLASPLNIRKGGTQFIALIRPYFALFVGASQEALKIMTNNQNKVR